MLEHPIAVLKARLKYLSDENSGTGIAGRERELAYMQGEVKRLTGIIDQARIERKEIEDAIALLERGA